MYHLLVANRFRSVDSWYGVCTDADKLIDLRETKELNTVIETANKDTGNGTSYDFNKPDCSECCS